MDAEINERFKAIESRQSNQDTRMDKQDIRMDKIENKIDKIDSRQDSDHVELVSIKKDTEYIKEVVKEVKEKWDNWDKDNFNQRDKIKWSIIGIFTSLTGGVMLAVILHFLSLK